VVAGEDDDWLYARLQAPLRQAVMSLGDRLVAAGALTDASDAFHLPLHWLRSFAAGRPLPGDVRRMAAEGRLAQREARAHPPPLAAPKLRGPAPRGSSNDPSAPVLRGTGPAGRTVGRVVHRHGPKGAVPPSDAVLVATTLLPTELPLIHAAALVCETGGPLDHVATQARERGLPAVVGVAGAVAALAEGDTVVVDADAGLVVRASR
jgi:pyruvate,water dikinase